MASASASGMWERHVPGISDFRLLYRMKWIKGEKLRTYVTRLWVRALKVLHENAKYAMMRKRIGLVAPGLRGEDWYFVDEGELLSVEEITKILKVSKPTIQRWCRNRKIPAAKIGKAYRIRREDLDRWYEEKLLEGVKR